MKKYRTTIIWALLPAFMAFMLAFSSCKKEDTPSGTGKQLEFVKLETEKDTIVVQELTKVKATVTGENITYSWRCDNELAVLDGSGAEIQFTICHAGKFKVTCEVKDSNNNTASKDVYITTIE